MNITIVVAILLVLRPILNWAQKRKGGAVAA
jgi:hypothetical protein